MATYYVRADGTAANKAAATSDSAASTAMSVSTHNGETFSAGDIIVVSDNGGVYRSQMTLPSSGSSGNPITYNFDAGVRLMGSNLFDSGWTTYSGNVYQVAATSQVYDLFYDGTQGDLRANAGDCTAEGHWYWASNVLYLYCAAGNPASVYTDTGVEGTARNTCLYSNRSYITFNGNGCEIGHANQEAVYLQGQDHLYDVIFDNFVVHDNRFGTGRVYQLIETVNTHNCQFKRLNLYHASWNALQVTVWAYSAGTYGDLLIEDCYIHDSDHNGIDLHNLSGRSPSENHTIRNCRVYNCGHNGIYVFNEGSASGYEISDTYVYGNISYYNGRCGIAFDRNGAGVYHAGSTCIGNTTYRNCWDSSNGWGPGISFAGVGGIIKNNICVDDNWDSPWYECCIYVGDGGGTQNTVDYNLVYRSDSETLLYYEDSTEYTHANYVTFGQQANAPTPADPLFTSAGVTASADFSLQSGSPAIGAADSSVGSPYDACALHPSSTWPTGVVNADQDDN